MTENRGTMRFLFGAMLGLASFLFAGQAAAGTLEDVRARGELRCGVHTGLAGFAALDRDGRWQGFETDYCRAIAAAVLGDAGAVAFVPLGVAERFAALHEGKVDVLAGTTAWTMSRETTLGIDFAAPIFYDGQAVMVPRSLGVASLLELSGATVCVSATTHAEQALDDYFGSRHMQLRLVHSPTVEAALAGYETAQCLALSGDASLLYAARLGLANPGAHTVLPEIISKEPLSLVVREGDSNWLDVVRWVHFALVDAEELGITAANVRSAVAWESEDVRSLLGVEGGLGVTLGLRADWVVRVLSAVGNYGEIFDRNLGARSPVGMARGLNALWNDGGLQYAAPIR